MVYPQFWWQEGARDGSSYQSASTWKTCFHKCSTTLLYHLNSKNAIIKYIIINIKTKKKKHWNTRQQAFYNSKLITQNHNICLEVYPDQTWYFLWILVYWIQIRNPFKSIMSVFLLNEKLKKSRLNLKFQTLLK